jgi:(p)ppGpp synthase/HD superfamily hydrolase
VSFRRTIKKLSEELTKACNVPVNVTNEDVREARLLMENADEATKVVVPYARAIAKKLGLKSTSACVEGEPKKLFRIFYKAVTQYEKVISDVPDIARMRLYIEKPEDIIKLRRMLLGDKAEYRHDDEGQDRLGVIEDPHPTNQISLVEFEDFYRVPSKTGRIGIHIQLDVKMPGNIHVPFEIQVMHREMAKTEDFTRDNYLQMKKIARTALAENRLPTDQEQESMDGYNKSSRHRYMADSLRLGLFHLQRPDLCTPKRQRAATMALVA